MLVVMWGIRVYPRVCGGNTQWRNRPPSRRGLSPRVRGKLRLSARNHGINRSIPACAGETAIGSAPTLSPEVYPRVCGGNPVSAALICGMRGLSPRVRGKPAAAAAIADGRRSIPACAGET